MKPIGIKFVCERADSEITTWHDNFNTSVENIIRTVRHAKNWMGGKFLEIYIEFEDEQGQYYKVYLDVNNYGFNQLLGT